MNKSIKIKDINIEHILKDKTITQSSKRQYSSTLNSIKKSKYGNKFLKNLYLLMSDMTKSLTPSQVVSWSNILTMSYKYYIDKDKTSKLLSQSLRRLSNKMRDNVEAPNKTDIEKYLRVSSLVKQSVDKLKSDTFRGDLLMYITAYLYTNVPPRRTDNRLLVNKKTNKVKSDFYIDLKNKTICYGKFKNQAEKICLDLKDHPSLIKAFVYLNLADNESLYPSKYQGQVNYSRYIKNIFKRQFNFDTTIQKLRRLYALRDIKLLNKLTETSKLMGHSNQIHMETYMKQ